MSLADDVFSSFLLFVVVLFLSRILSSSSDFLSCSGSCGFGVGSLDGISIFLRLLQLRSVTIGGNCTAFLILELERTTGMYCLSHFGLR